MHYNVPRPRVRAARLMLALAAMFGAVVRHLRHAYSRLHEAGNGLLITCRPCSLCVSGVATLAPRRQLGADAAGTGATGGSAPAAPPANLSRSSIAASSNSSNSTGQSSVIGSVEGSLSSMAHSIEDDLHHSRPQTIAAAVIGGLLLVGIVGLGEGLQTAGSGG